MLRTTAGNEDGSFRAAVDALLEKGKKTGVVTSDEFCQLGTLGNLTDLEWEALGLSFLEQGVEVQ
jgi:hypothetical protein